MIEKYIGLKHEYGVVDCIQLIDLFYKNELGISFGIPEYVRSKRWMRNFTTDFIDEWSKKYGIKYTKSHKQAQMEWMEQEF